MSSPILLTIDDVWNIARSVPNFYPWMLEIKSFLDVSPDVFSYCHAAVRSIKGVLISLRDSSISEKSIHSSRRLYYLRAGHPGDGIISICPILMTKNFFESTRLRKKPFCLAMRNGIKTLCMGNWEIGTMLTGCRDLSSNLDPSYGTCLKDLPEGKVVVTKYYPDCYEYTVYLSLEDFRGRIEHERRFSITKSARKQLREVVS